MSLTYTAISLFGHAILFAQAIRLCTYLDQQSHSELSDRQGGGIFNHHTGGNTYVPK